MSFSCRPPKGFGSALLDRSPVIRSTIKSAIDIPVPGRLAQLKQLFVKLFGGGKKPAPKPETKDKEADIIKTSEE